MHLPLLVEFLEVGKRESKGGKKRETRERERGRERKKREERKGGREFLRTFIKFLFSPSFPFSSPPFPLSSLFSLSFFSPSFFIWRWFSCSPGWPRSLYVAGDYLELIFLFSSPGCWNERHTPPCLDYLEVKFGDLWMLSKHSTNLVLSADSTLIFLMLWPITMSEYHTTNIKPHNSGIGRWLSSFIFFFFFLFFQKTQIWFLAPSRLLKTICKSSFKKSNATLWLLWVPDMHMVHRYTCRKYSDT